MYGTYHVVVLLNQTVQHLDKILCKFLLAGQEFSKKCEKMTNKRCKIEVDTTPYWIHRSSMADWLVDCVIRTVWGPVVQSWVSDNPG